MAALVTCDNPHVTLTFRALHLLWQFPCSRRNLNAAAADLVQKWSNNFVIVISEGDFKRRLSYYVLPILKLRDHLQERRRVTEDHSSWPFVKDKPSLFVLVGIQLLDLAFCKVPRLTKFGEELCKTGLRPSNSQTRLQKMSLTSAFSST